MLVIGLTGGILSGKTTRAKLLSELGAVVIDADKLGHELYKPHTEVWHEIVTAFGREILTANNEIDRQKLSEIVFRDPSALEQLNQIMHPRMYLLVKERIEELRRQGIEVVVLEAPLLIEANWLDLVDQVWVTVAPEAIVLSRLCDRAGLTEEQAKARIHSQMSTEERIKYADVVLNTDCELEQAREQIERLWHKLKSAQR